MIKILPILHFLLALSIIYLKIIYGNLHWSLAKLFRIENISNELRPVVAATDQLLLTIIILAAISLIIAFICFRKRIYGRLSGLIILLVSILCFLFSMIVM